MTPGAAPDARDRETGTRALLDDIARGDPDEALRLGDLFHGLGERSFGMLLFVSTIPAFIPIPGLGGAIGGPLAILIGVQLLIGLQQPWLPGFVARRGPHRRSMARFRDLLAPWLARLEKVVRPRATALLDNRLADAFTGALLVLLGLLLSLPIPLTNYLFGGLLLLFALALLERDGWLLGAAWVAGTVAVAVFGVLSGNLAAMAARWIDLLF
ncbi:exopolysaccharide biosynthesis protein [Vulcaniibacterium tengchongense]|uniref:Exopolysaccharide synthesis protein ExoD n=1 Tax=Vulcaniibacterium tengchongense TaxID=1273429 RepID=A0A3N4W7U4_9GAMM|nr:exopolysaccharide biosynthesis protein [Vulcaniibacterium tengchongense]RPE81294.1 hypothetical protein EDC50_0479 [Vulcaniibacterium tengchongense]